MRAVVQRVLKSSVKVDGRVIASTGKGLMVFVGAGKDDTRADAEWMAEKITNLRIFEDEDGKMNLSARELGHEVVVVSQFTLYGDCRHGRRPSFSDAMEPSRAQNLLENLIEMIKDRGVRCLQGVFGQKMEVEIINDGPVTLLLDSKKLF
jgi:D-tyrosyl-tRNA(Tyr) deacylase